MSLEAVALRVVLYSWYDYIAGVVVPAIRSCSPNTVCHLYGGVSNQLKHLTGIQVTQVHNYRRNARIGGTIKTTVKGIGCFCFTSALEIHHYEVSVGKTNALPQSMLTSKY